MKRMEKTLRSPAVTLNSGHSASLVIYLLVARLSMPLYYFDSDGDDAAHENAATYCAMREDAEATSSPTKFERRAFSPARYGPGAMTRPLE